MKPLNLPVLLVGAFFAEVIAGDTCDNLKFTSEIDVAGPSWPRWHWSTACTALTPSCVLLPTSTEDVVDIVNLLRDSDEPFAVKSGGHNPNPYFASVDGGPLISLEKLNEVTLDREAQTVRVGPGNRWGDVQEALDGSGYTVVGGRIGHVGVGGLLLGCGLSFLSAQHGWASNSVLEYDIVLANGTAVTVSATSHPDLFVALRGGGNNFGIVTSFLLQAYPQGDIWGGTMIFQHTEERAAKLLGALRDFTEHCDDEKAGVIMVNVQAPEILTDMWVLFTFYDGPEAPAGVFDNFTAAEPSSDSSGTKSYAQLLSEGNVDVIHGTIYTMTTETLPLPDTENGADVLGAIHARWRETSGSVLKNTTGISANVAYQPFTKDMARIARENGGDLLDIDDDVDRIIMEYNYSHLFKEEHEPIDRATVKTSQGTGELISGFQEDGRLPEVYRPLFMNDAYFRQDYWGRMKPASQELAARVVADVDPEGMWRSRTGGLKP